MLAAVVAWASDLAEDVDGVDEGVDVVLFGGGRGAAQREVGERADLGEDEDEAGEQVGSEASVAAIAVPVVLRREGRDLLVEVVERRAGRVGRHAIAVEEGFGVGDARQQGADGVAVALERGAVVSEDDRDVEAVGVVEGAGQQRNGDGEADVVEVSLGSEAVLGDLVDVEGELCADVLVLSLGEVDVGAVLRGEGGELGSDGEVDGFGVADGVAQVVGERADGKGNVVGGFGVAEEGADEVSGADVVQQVGEERLAEGIVAEVLDDASAVGVGAGFAELGRE